MEVYSAQTWGKTERASQTNSSDELEWVFQTQSQNETEWTSQNQKPDEAEWTPQAQESDEFEWTPAEFDELTDCAERIRAPLDHQLYFDFKNGDLHCNTASNGEGLKAIAETALQVAIAATKNDPRWVIEALRRRIEYDEITQVINMPDGQLLILSPTPDAVIESCKDIGVGYNLTKKSIMLRLWKRVGDEFACRYVSLNGGHKAGLAAGLEALDQPQPTTNSSEDWLRGRWHFPANIDVASEMIAAYDAYLQNKFGGDWSYGMEALTESAALTIVSEWPDLLVEHMTKLQTATTPAEKEALRYNYAAAIEARRAGDLGISMDAAGDAAHMNGEDFSGYCETIDIQTNNEAMQELGLARKKWMHCPYCGGSVFGDPCSPGICPHCDSAPGRPTKDLNANRKKIFTKTKPETAATTPETTTQNFIKFQATKTEVKSSKNIQKSADDLALLKHKWRVVRNGLLNGIEALVDEENDEVIAVGFKAKNLEYLRQEQETTWFKIV